MRVITVRQPHASALILDDPDRKDIENRSRPMPKTVKVGDRIAIHAGKHRVTPKEEHEFLRNHGFALGQIRAQIGFGDFIYGAIIGTVQYDGWITDSNSVWAIPGLKHWMFSDPKPCKPIYCQGKQGLWTVDDSLIEYLEAK